MTKLGKIHVRSAEEHQAENIRKMLVAMAEDVRVVLIKLGDRLHNMRTISAHTTERRLRISRETLDIYAPLAHRLGIWEIKGELEDLAFVQLDPDNYHLIEARLASNREQRDAFVRDVTEILGREFAPLGMEAEIAGRTKHTYSIHEKMLRGQKEFGEIYDIIAIRVLVDSIKDCYGALGVVHSLWKPLPGRFKDYIAMPKGNGYQSLHTTVLSHTGEPMEVQIRTQEMHETSEYGVAAHWRYKGGQDGARIDERFTWLRLPDGLAEGGARRRGLRQHRQGRHLPGRGVRVHAARRRALAAPGVDPGGLRVSHPHRRRAQLHRREGQRTDGAARSSPRERRDRGGAHHQGAARASRDWLNFVKTSSAREKIRQWFKRERRDENIQKGREMLDKEFRRLRQMSLSGVKDDQLLRAGTGIQDRDHRRLRRRHRVRRHQRAQRRAQVRRRRTAV